MRKNATFISFFGIKPEENVVRAAKNGKKSRKSRRTINFVAESWRCRLPTHDHTAKIHLKYDKNYTRHLLLYKKRQINGLNAGN